MEIVRLQHTDDDDYDDDDICVFCAVEVTVSPMGCNTLMVSYTVNPLPGDGNEATLRSLEVSYRPIFGVGREGNRSAALNGNTMDGVLCLSNLPLNTDYRITCGVEMKIGHSNVLLSDLSAPIEMTTGTTCNQQQCNEISKTRTKTNSKSPPTCSSTMRPSPTPTGKKGCSTQVCNLATPAVLLLLVYIVTEDFGGVG